MFNRNYTTVYDYVNGSTKTHQVCIMVDFQFFYIKHKLGLQSFISIFNSFIKILEVSATIHYLINYCMVGNFRGVQIFVDFVCSACPQKITVV